MKAPTKQPELQIGIADDVEDDPHAAQDDDDD
jgi:hypothetical protein